METISRDRKESLFIDKNGQLVTAPKCHAGFIGNRKGIATTNNRQI